MTALVDLEAERILVGALIVRPELLDDVLDVVHPQHFSLPLHRWAYEAITDLRQEAGEINEWTVRCEIEKAHPISETDRKAINELTDGMPRMSGAIGVARKVRGSARRREFANQLRKALEAANGPDDTDEIMGSLASQVQRLMEAGDSTHTFGCDVVVKQALAEMDAFSRSQTGLTGIPSGIRSLDDLTGGWQRGGLYIIAARPARGKSVMLAQSAVEAAMAGHKVLSFTLEMPPSQVMQRLICGEARVERYELRHGRRSEEAWTKVGKAAGRLTRLPIWWDDRESPTLATISATARRIQSNEGLDLLVVDYLQRCAVDRKLERYAAIGELVRGLKGLARALNVPVLVAAQVSRAGQEAKPTLAMLREAGDIEQESDFVGFLHPADGVEGDMTKDEPAVDLLVEKNRHGATMPIPLVLERRYTRFVERSHALETTFIP